MRQKAYGFFAGLLVIFNISTAQQVRITEIMSDPDPVIGLAPAEYIELYNAGEKSVSLAGWTVRDASGRTGSLDSSVLEPGEWRIMCSRKDQHYFSAGRPVIADPWIVLNNDTDLIILRDQEGNMADSIAYRRTWHRPDARDGGVALERLSLFYRCDPGDNWRSSDNVNGGTPGAPNSVSFDVADSLVVSLFAARDIHLWFSQDLDTVSLQQAQIQIYPRLDVDKIEFTNDELTIKTLHPPDHRKEYELSLAGLFTCSGSPVNADRLKIRPARPVKPGELKVNEIMFDPGNDRIEYIELINVTNDPLDLSGLRISCNRDVSREDDVILDTLYSIRPGGVLVVTKDKQGLISAFPAAPEEMILELGGMISLPDDRASIVLEREDRIGIEEVYYHHSFHHMVISSKKGIALERRSPFNAGRAWTDWASASAASGYGTPGAQNSQYHVESSPPLIRISPDVASAGNEVSVVYSGLPPNSVLTVRIFDLNGMLLETVAEGYTSGTSGQLLFEVSADLAGNGLLLVWCEVLSDGGGVFRKTGRIYVR